MNHHFDPVARYRDVSLGTRAFLKARWHLTPYSVMASKLPKEGRILDLGCGHGLLSMVMATEAPKRDVLALDHDTDRVRAASEAAKDITNLKFEHGSVLAPPAGPYAGIAVIDVMHYFDRKLQNAIMDGMREALQPGGVLILREVDPQGGMISTWNRVYERIATATGFTRARDQGLHFRTQKDWTDSLSRSGFSVTSERCSSPLFADILYVCKRA